MHENLLILGSLCLATCSVWLQHCTHIWEIAKGLCLNVQSTLFIPAFDLTTKLAKWISEWNESFAQDEINNKR